MYVTFAGWQVTLCDPHMWHVMWVPVAVWQPCELLYTCYLLTYSESREAGRAPLPVSGVALQQRSQQGDTAAHPAPEMTYRPIVSSGALNSINSIHPSIAAHPSFTMDRAPLPGPTSKGRPATMKTIVNDQNVLNRSTLCDDICLLLSCVVYITVREGERMGPGFLNHRCKNVQIKIKYVRKLL